MPPSCNLWLHLLIFSKSSGGLAPIVQFLASSTKLSAWSSEALPPKVCRRGHSNKLFQGLVSLAKFPRPVKFCAAQESSIVEPVVTCPFRYTIKKAAFLSTQGSNPTHHPEELFVRRLTGANSCQGWRAARLPSTSACHPMKPGPRALRPTALALPRLCHAPHICFRAFPKHRGHAPALGTTLPASVPENWTDALVVNTFWSSTADLDDKEIVKANAIPKRCQGGLISKH